MRLQMNRRHFLGAGAGAAALPFLPLRAHASTPFTMQSAWINDAEFAGYFVGQDQGYYEAEGLDLTYLSGGPDVIPEGQIIAGRADLSLTTPDTTIKAIAEQGAAFKIIGAQYQKNPIGIVSLARSPILTPQDMIGKTIAVPPVNTISVEAVLAINGIERSQVNIVPYSYDPTPLIRGEIDASLDFTTNVPYTIQTMGEEAVSFLLYDYGFTIYNDTVVVTEDTLRTRRAELVGWLRASRRGWVENFEDPGLWPPRWMDTWFAGTGRSLENELFFNRAQQPLMNSSAGYLAMTEEGIAANLEALARVGINGTRDMFDTTLLEEI